MTQISTRRVTYFAILLSTSFKAGVSDAATGRPFNDKLASSICWGYERGRIFATALRAQGKPIPTLPRRGQRRVLFTGALVALRNMFKDGTLI